MQWYTEISASVNTGASKLLLEVFPPPSVLLGRFILQARCCALGGPSEEERTETCVLLTPGDEPVCFLGPVLVPPEMFFATFLSFCSKKPLSDALGVSQVVSHFPLHPATPGGSFWLRDAGGHRRWMGLRWGDRGSAGGPREGVFKRRATVPGPPRCPPAPGALSPQAGPARGRRRLPPPFPLPLPWQPSPWRPLGA